MRAVSGQYSDKNEVILNTINLVRKLLKNETLIQEDSKKLGEIFKIDASELCHMQKEKI